MHAYVLSLYAVGVLGMLRSHFDFDLMHAMLQFIIQYILILATSLDF